MLTMNEKDKIGIYLVIPIMVTTSVIPMGKLPKR